MTQAHPRKSNQSTVAAISLAGDTVFTFLALSFAYWLRFETALKHVGVPPEGAHYQLYIPLLVLGTLSLIATFSYLGLYNDKQILHLHRTFLVIVKGSVFWFFAYLGTSLALKFEPQISRMFVTLALFTSGGLLTLWRIALHKLLLRKELLPSLQKNVAILGINKDASKLYQAMSKDKNHPYNPVGIIFRSDSEDQITKLDVDIPGLGSDVDLETHIKNHEIEILIIATSNLKKEKTLEIATICERNYVAFKIVPSSFQVFLSGLNLQNISGIPILGIETLPLDRMGNRVIKRIIDILGGLVGLLISIPLMAILAIFIKRESKGSVLYKQIRTGKNGEPFKIYKLRSMRTDAEKENRAQWAIENDPRRTKIGQLMRQTNLDEIPQFWNVLKGEMSLVGPRPERPELIEGFLYEVQHYQTRHSVKPGLTGWAQINGLRGNTSLESRIQYDLFYIENWSVWMDVYIMVMTLVRRKNAY
ncbi:MAG: sugar transferase [Verrucomicrobia bacterium]|nr:sugar transferase [Verrucomicrobiota bacterium]MDA1065140.1 sugar transferase [Verrucomicrobiota bacterium]